MRRMAWTVAGVLALQILLLLGIRAFLSPPAWRAAEAPGFACRLPWPAFREAWSEGPWTGLSATLAADWRLAVRPLEGDAAAAVEEEARRLHPRAVERLPVPGVPGAIFLLSGQGKRWRASLLVPRGDRTLLLADVLQDRGNAAEPLLAVARLAAGARAADGSWEGPDRDLLEAVADPAVRRHLATMDQVAPVVGVALVPALALALGIAWFQGRLPGRAPEAPPPRLAESHVWVVRGRGLRRKGSVGALVLDAQGLGVHAWGREVARVPAHRLDGIRRVPGRRPGRPFAFDDGETVLRFQPADPARWEAALGLPRDGAA